MLTLPLQKCVRIVLDTNVLVSALMSVGTPPDKLYEAWQRKDYDLITSRWQVSELSNVLNRPKVQRYIQSEERKQLFEEIDNHAEFVHHLPTVHLSPDPDDNHILATAIAGDANYLVTGDKRDLLELVDVQGIPIVTPRQALQWLN